jgi:hypothetical protein
MGAKVYLGEVGEVGSPKRDRQAALWQQRLQICNLTRFFATLFSRLPVNIRSGVLLDFAATGARDFAVMLSHFC